MNDSGFKKYIENRTIEEIMNDYGEQRGEYETLLRVGKEGNVIPSQK